MFSHRKPTNKLTKFRTSLPIKNKDTIKVTRNFRNKTGKINKITITPLEVVTTKRGNVLQSGMQYFACNTIIGVLQSLALIGRLSHVKLLRPWFQLNVAIWNWLLTLIKYHCYILYDSREKIIPLKISTKLSVLVN